MEGPSLVVIDIVPSHCKRNAFEKADAREESRNGKLQSHRNDCSATLAPVRVYLERRRDASTRERVRPPLWLPSSFSFSYSFSLSLGNSLPLPAARGKNRWRTVKTYRRDAYGLLYAWRKSIYTMKERPDVLRRWRGRRDGTEFIDFTSILLTSPSRKERR